MKIVIARTAGFCMGVHRAVEMALDAPAKHRCPIYTCGPLIHNPQFLQLLEEKGVFVLESVPSSGQGTVLIRAHGVPPETKEALKTAGFHVIDATCPRVIKVQTIIRKYAKKGYACIIIGDADHPEVVGLKGFAGENGYVAGNMDELKSLPLFNNAIIVAQTTQNMAFYRQVKEWIHQHCPHYLSFDTICDSTENRQNEVKEIASSADAVVVVGGKTSGNTRRLADIASRGGKPVYHIETESELDFNALESARCIAITAGASTPNWIIKRVYRTLETLPLKRRSGWRKWEFAVKRTLLLTNIYVSLGAGCLCYASTSLLGIASFFPYVTIAMLYVLSMHIMNNLIGTKADRYNDPERGMFYEANKFGLSLLALIAGGAGLLTAAAMGFLPFGILLVMSILGLSYNLRIIPGRNLKRRMVRIRDIPGSKTVLIAAAWGIVTSIFPSLSASGQLSAGTMLVFIWSATMVFIRTAFFDILDMQGDRIVGKATLPLVLGEQRALRLITYLAVILIFGLITGSVLHLIPFLGVFLSVCPAILLAIITAHTRGYTLPGIRLEFVVETTFIIAGIISLLWSAGI